MLNQDVFTTGAIAKICDVASRTVTKWFDSGRLKGYKLPNSLDRRVPRYELIRFMREMGMPLDKLGGSVNDMILLVGVPAGIASALAEKLDTVMLVGSAFEAGIKFTTLRPKAVVADITVVGRIELAALCAAARLHNVLVIALVGAEDQIETCAVFRKPIDFTLLVEQLRIVVKRSAEAAG